VWDLHWTAPPGGSARRPLSGPWAVPGTYTVKLTAAGRTYSQPLTVVLDPRVTNVSPKDLAAQFAAAQQVNDMIGKVTQAREQAAKLHKQLQQLHTSAAANQAVVAAVDAVDTKLMAVLGQPARGYGAANEDFTTLEYLGRALPELANSISSAPAAPTEGDLTAVQSLRKLSDSDLAAWNAIQATDLPSLKSLMRQNGLPSLE
jgi:hypothetical protein